MSKNNWLDESNPPTQNLQTLLFEKVLQRLNTTLHNWQAYETIEQATEQYTIQHEERCNLHCIDFVNPPGK